MKMYRLNEKCMAATAKGVRCKNGGTQRHADGSTRYAICGQHADMLMEGKPVSFVAHITAENVADSVNQAKLPGLDNNVKMAREALSTPEEGNVIEVFYVRKLEPGKVLVLHKEVIINIDRWSKSSIMVEAIHHMPNIEGMITGLLARDNKGNKAAWNRKTNGWVERPVPTNLIIVTNNNA